MSFSIAIAIGRISSVAFGATTTPPIISPVAGRQKSFTKPSRSPDILARALVVSGSVIVLRHRAVVDRRPGARRSRAPGR